MKRFFNHISTVALTRCRYCIVCTIIIMSYAVGIKIQALDASAYNTSSVLSEGKWVKIKVEKTGMQLISDAQLRSWGFKDPAKVNVYGYGGREISLRLDNRQHDDLPLLPSVHTSTGILFYGVNTTSWVATSQGQMDFIHSRNPYSDQAYYFISDRETTNEAQQSMDCGTTQTVGAIDIFTERLAHEVDIEAPGQSGRLILGEDFRTNPKQTFTFETPGLAGDELSFCVNFGVNSTNGTSSLIFKANGNQVESTSSDNIPGISNSLTFIRTQQIFKHIAYNDNKLQLEINFTPGGALKIARLDYICINYPRRLSLDNGQILFGLNLDKTDNKPVKIGGCSSTTRLWDVTDPATPIEIKYTLSGTDAYFQPTGNGVHDYIAFDSQSISSASTPTNEGNIATQDIHGLEIPQMVIISPREYESEAERIADMHRRLDGWTVHVLRPENIYNEFSSGTPDVSAFRKLHKMWYDRSAGMSQPFRYSLLFGRPTYDNRMITEQVKASKYPRLPIWQSAEGTSPNTSYSTDDLIAMLDDNESSDLNMSSAQLRIAVGRIPVKSQSEAKNAVDKLINYVENPEYGVWRNTVLMIADDQDNAVHFDQAQDVYSALRTGQTGQSYIYERLYMDTYPMVYTPTGMGYPLARERLFRTLDDGVALINYTGHSNAKSWTHEGLLRYPDIIGLDNKHFPFIYAATCEFGEWDADDVSGAEIMALSPTSGAIGFIAASRPVYISMNGILNRVTSKNFLTPDQDGKGRRIGDIYRMGKNNFGTSDDNKLRYLLLADPAMRVPLPQLCAEVTEIGGKTLDNKDDLPVIPARGRVVVKGRISDRLGNTVSDFNGTLIPTLYDAERPIETLGNGETGVKRIYNDRQNKLFTGRVPVRNGEWETTILMPGEIDNNYSPALLNLYAWSDKGVEANGYTEDLYVYGWDENAPDDKEGPDITQFTLNSDRFQNGDVVNSSPLLLASMRDDSGINISTGGIGHQITLKLDGEVLTDAADAYRPDDTDPAAGHITYPMSNIDPGDHTLSLTVWDNAGNSSSCELEFRVSLHKNPTIFDITPNANPASTAVIFYVTHDLPATEIDSTIEIFDISGRKVCQIDHREATEAGSPAQIGWDLCDSSGNRVPRGIYIYRTTITSPDGLKSTESRKIAVTDK